MSYTARRVGFAKPRLAGFSIGQGTAFVLTWLNNSVQVESEVSVNASLRWNQNFQEKGKDHLFQLQQQQH